MYLFLKRKDLPLLLTLLVIRVVLLQTLYGLSNPLIPQLYVDRYNRLLILGDLGNFKARTKSNRLLVTKPETGRLSSKPCP